MLAGRERQRGIVVAQNDVAAVKMPHETGVIAINGSAAVVVEGQTFELGRCPLANSFSSLHSRDRGCLYCSR